MDEEPPGSKVPRLAPQRKVNTDEDIEQLLRDLGDESDDGLELFDFDDEPDEESDGENDDDDSNLPNLSNDNEDIEQHLRVLGDESDDGLELFDFDDEPDEESDGENDDDDSNLPNLSNDRAGVIPENIELTSEQSLENENVEQDSADSIDARIVVLPGLDANSLNNLNVASLEFISEPDKVANDINFQVVQIVPAENFSHHVLPEEATTSTQLDSTEDIIVAPDFQVIEQPPSVIPAPLDHLPAAGSGASPPPSRTWKRNRPSVPNIPFTGSTGLKVLPKEQTPLGYFELFFTTALFEFLADEANEYSQFVLFKSRGPRSRINDWKLVTPDEMKTFMGIIFLMRLIRVNRVQDCWKTHYLFGLSFPQFMSRDRFLLILRCLHFESEHSSEDPTFKIKPMMNYFNEKMETLCHPSRILSIDESMVLWRGRLSWRQCLKGKRHKYGMKLYVLSEPNGLVHKIYIHGGVEDIAVSGQDHTGKVVRKLLEGKEGKGHSLFMDNFYNSVPLTRKLLDKKTYCSGTLQGKRRGNPKGVVKMKLKKGEHVTRYTHDGIGVCKWKDKRDVLAVSSEFSGDIRTTTNKYGQEQQKPEMIIEYNRNMKGVDRQDQMLAYYPITHKTVRWYKKLGVHIFHLMLNNSFYLYNMYNTNSKKMDLHDFDLEIVTKLLPKPAPTRTYTVFAIHLPELLPKGTNNKTLRKRCKQCSETKKLRKESIYGCPLCPGFPGFCLSPCFRAYHNYK